MDRKITVYSDCVKYQYHFVFWWMRDFWSHRIIANLITLMHILTFSNCIWKAAKGHREKWVLVPVRRQGWSANSFLDLSKPSQYLLFSFHSAPEVVRGLFTCLLKTIITHSRNYLRLFSKKILNFPPPSCFLSECLSTATEWSEDNILYHHHSYKATGWDTGWSLWPDDWA